jgi:hypothetical protein
LLETLGFVLKVGACHYTGEIFLLEKQGFENGLFLPFLVIFCFHDTKCPLVFLRVATVAASVITDYKILNMRILLRGINIIFENWLPRRSRGPLKENFHHFWVN